MSEEEYENLSHPLRYFLLLLVFVVVPVGAYVYFYKGGKQRIALMMGRNDYEKMTPV
jgi:hypothetical protein